MTPEQRADTIRREMVVATLADRRVLAINLLPPGSRVVVPGDGHVVLTPEQAEKVRDTLDEWNHLGDLPSGGYGGTLRKRTSEALALLAGDQA